MSRVVHDPDFFLSGPVPNPNPVLDPDPKNRDPQRTPTQKNKKKELGPDPKILWSRTTLDMRILRINIFQ